MGKVRLEDPWPAPSARGEEREGQGLAFGVGRAGASPAVPPGGACRVRGLGLRDSGRLAVTAALGWPFPAL